MNACEIPHVYNLNGTIHFYIQNYPRFLSDHILIALIIRSKVIIYLDHIVIALIIICSIKLLKLKLVKYVLNHSEVFF